MAFLSPSLGRPGGRERELSYHEWCHGNGYRGTIYQIEWESNSARALIQFQGTGDAITSVTVTDNCTGQIETLSAITIIE